MPIVSIFSGARMTTPDIHAVLLSYVRDGVLRDPAVMGLRSFAREELEARGFDACGNPAQICLYEEQRHFRRAGRAVQLACKVFLAQGRWCANGLELGYQVRLAGVLRAVGKPAMPAFRVLLRRDARCGALLFDNGLVLRFAANLRGAPRHYFLTHVEGHVPAPAGGEPALRAASQAPLDALYHTCTPEQLRRLARRDHAPLQELIRLLS